MDIRKIIAEMSLEEKASFVSGATAWTTDDLEQAHGVPAIFMCDGPHGLRKQDLSLNRQADIYVSIDAVCFPTACATAASFDRQQPSGPRPESLGDIDYSSVYIHHINEASANRLNELYRKLKEKGADMVIAGYPIPMYENVPSAQEYDALTQELNDALDAPVISNLRDYRYDTSYFYDTYAHLTDMGVYVRTNQLIQDLQGYINISN